LVGALVVVTCALVASAGARTLAAPEVTVSGFSPTTAIVGQIVTISGQSLEGTQGVTFGNTPSQSVSVDPYGTWVRAVVPPGVGPGNVYMTLDVMGTPESVGPLHLNPGTMAPQANPQPALAKPSTGVAVKVVLAPRIVSISPTAGRIGTLVKISGANLSGTRWVSFGGVRTTHVVVLSSSAVTAKVPRHARSGKLTIHTSGGTSRTNLRFAVVGAAGL
jgi:hypothetical protein